ncbi:MAG TPA: ABC transporter ATP-binding protein [Steroidobacteraceae bacterium]|nr:ABC transporter ATP-binding protein [Steroidobacteraceae bacterium]
MADAIVFNGISKRFGERPALRTVSFAVPSGCIFGLVGLNGAGKTTLIKCLLDFTFPDAGDVRIFSLPATDAMARRPLAYLPERFMPPSYLTGLEYLQMMSRLYGVTLENHRIETAVAAIDLDPAYLPKRVGSYSKGSGQKLGIAAVLLSERDLLVLDEPMSGLDPRARAFLKAEIKSAHRRGATVLFSSHSLADIEELCDGFALLHEGEIRFIGGAAELCERTGARTLDAAFLKAIETRSP